jgi:hypothetical protein
MYTSVGKFYILWMLTCICTEKAIKIYTTTTNFHSQFAANLPTQFAVNLHSGRMSPPTEQDLPLPSLLSAPPPNGVRPVTGLPASATPRGPLVSKEDQQLQLTPPYACPPPLHEGLMRPAQAGWGVSDPSLHTTCPPPLPLPFRLPQPGCRRSVQA